MVEYALAKPGTYLAVEAAALCADRFGQYRADANRGAYLESVGLSNSQFEHGIRQLHD